MDSEEALSSGDSPPGETECLGETPSLESLEEILHSGHLSCNHVDEVWPNLFLGDMWVQYVNKNTQVWFCGESFVTSQVQFLVNCTSW